VKFCELSYATANKALEDLPTVGVNAENSHIGVNTGALSAVTGAGFRVVADGTPDADNTLWLTAAKVAQTKAANAITKIGDLVATSVTYNVREEGEALAAQLAAAVAAGVVDAPAANLCDDLNNLNAAYTAAMAAAMDKKKLLDEAITAFGEAPDGGEAPVAPVVPDDADAVAPVVEEALSVTPLMLADIGEEAVNRADAVVSVVGVRDEMEGWALNGAAKKTSLKRIMAYYKTKVDAGGDYSVDAIIAAIESDRSKIKKALTLLKKVSDGTITQLEKSDLGLALQKLSENVVGNVIDSVREGDALNYNEDEYKTSVTYPLVALRYAGRVLGIDFFPKNNEELADDPVSGNIANTIYVGGMSVNTLIKQAIVLDAGTLGEGPRCKVYKKLQNYFRGTAADAHQIFDPVAFSGIVTGMVADLGLDD
jgi:hypothetical protein